MIHTKDIKIPPCDWNYKNEKYDNWIVRLFISEAGNKIRQKFSKMLNSPEKYPNIVDYIFHRYKDAENPIEVLRRIQYNIEERPICPACSGRVEFNGRPNCDAGLFKKYCSQRCANKTTNNWQYADQEKALKTKEERYGSRGYCNPTKGVQTRKEKYGSANNIEKVKQTKLERYGDPYYKNSEKVK